MGENKQQGVTRNEGTIIPFNTQMELYGLENRQGHIKGQEKTELNEQNVSLRLCVLMSECLWKHLGDKSWIIAFSGVDGKLVMTRFKNKTLILSVELILFDMQNVHCQHEPEITLKHFTKLTLLLDSQIKNKADTI